jgi:hypothetical protein
MTTLTIDIDKLPQIEELRKVARENMIHVSYTPEAIRMMAKLNITNGTAMAKMMEHIAANGGLTSFGDASKWQTETRKDKVLFGREED